MGLNRKQRQSKLKQLFAISNDCYYCGIKLDINNATLDHKLPRSRGGSNKTSNLALSCNSCNSEKRNMTVREFSDVSAIDNSFHYDISGAY